MMMMFAGSAASRSMDVVQILPGRDGVVVVDGDLHRGSIACDLFLATYYWLSDGGGCVR
jgi:hypothetical protein